MLVNHANGYIEEKNGNKYLVFDYSINENKELQKHEDFWNGIKNKIQKINGGECNSVEEIIMEKITWKLNLILTMTYH